MKPEQQRIAIAQACGWELVIDNPLYEPYWEDPKGNKIGVSCGMRFPDYLNDLNAMHEAEKVIPDLVLYRRFIYLVVLDYPSNTTNEPAFATAAQRAEAFLRTIGKWVSE